MEPYPVTRKVAFDADCAYRNASAWYGNHNGSLANTTLVYSPSLFNLTFDVKSTGTINDDGTP